MDRGASHPLTFTSPAGGALLRPPGRPGPLGAAPRSIAGPRRAPPAAPGSERQQDAASGYVSASPARPRRHPENNMTQRGRQRGEGGRRASGPPLPAQAAPNHPPPPAAARSPGPRAGVAALRAPRCLPGTLRRLAGLFCFPVEEHGREGGVKEVGSLCPSPLSTKAPPMVLRPCGETQDGGLQPVCTAVSVAGPAGARALCPTPAGFCLPLTGRSSEPT